MGSTVQQLREAKAHSDEKRYAQKHDIVRRLMQAAPQEWVVDQQQGRYHGVTHTPSGFRLHMPVEHILDSIKRTGEQAAWEAVPAKVAFIVRDGGRIQRQIRDVLRSMPQGDGDNVQVYWRPDKKSLAVSFPDGTDEPTKNRWTNRLRTLQGVSGIETDCEWVPPDAVRIKSAVLGAIGNAWTVANKAIGGPNPLTNVIAGGLLGGGLGYAAGTVAEQFLPQRQFRRGKLRRLMAMVGAAPLVGYGLWKGTANARLDGGGFLNGMVTSDYAPVKQALQLLDAVEIDPVFKQAIDYATGLMGGGTAEIRSIPVDVFNQAVWHDVRQGVTAERNPWGTRDPWGDNTTPIHTPPAVGAATTAILSGIDARQGGSGWISPGDIVRGLAGAAVGAGTAHVAGLALGALAGLKPEAQRQLQTAGAFGGLLMSIVPPLFGR